MRLRLFGPPRATLGPPHGAEEAALPNERRTQLVVWLALKRAWVGRRELAALLWPEQESPLAFANLRKALHRLPSAPWAPGLEAQGQALRFVADTDVQDFEAALAQGRLDDALALGQGELLQGFDDLANNAWTEWLQFERERLRAAWRGAALARLAQDDLEPGAAEALAARLVANDPLDEAAVAAQMRVLARGGQLSGARAAFRAYAERVQQELGVAPAAALRALHEGLGRASGAPVAAPGPAAPPETDADPEFVGRATELQRIAELLAQEDCALLCLIGPGGVGKTRLARRAMQLLSPGFADGAAFVPLEDVPGTAEVGTRLATALGLTLGVALGPAQTPALGSQRTVLDEVRRALAPRRMLLVLDNFEHLAADVAWLDELVQDAPGLKVIVTSRVRPVARRGWTLPVEGLPCPAAEDEDLLETFDAARLFVRAARRVEPALVPATEAAAIVDICRQVEGLPLALELAASFTRVLSCEAIAAELRSGTELLRAADPSRPPRQASMETVFEQSWRHLAPAERDSLARLALFRGGFSVAAARSVAAASLPVLAALVDKSLLRKDGARCHLHPLLQQFALLRLGDGPAHQETASAHSHHYLRHLAEAREALVQGRREAMAETEAEFENLRAAWHWAAARGPAPDLMRAAPALMAYCDHRGRWTEGLGLFDEALAAPAAQAHTGLAAALGAAAAHLAHRLDRYAEAEARAARWLVVARKAGDGRTEIQCTKVLAATCLRLGRLPEARRWYQRTLKLAQAAADAVSAAGTLDNLSLLERNLGRLDAALSLSRQALLQHRALADAAGEALCLNNQGVLLTLRKELDAAREALLAGRQLCERHGLPTTRAMIEANLADIADKQGDTVAMQRHAEAALEISQGCGLRSTEAVAHQLLMVAARRRGDLPAARSELSAAMQLALAIGRPVMQVNSAYLLATLLAAQGDRDGAARVMSFVLTHATIVGSDREWAEAQIAAWGGQLGADWSGPPLAELLRRAIAEADLGYAPLLAELRAGA
ncbi:MAG: AAA family ATPase [Rubrivivax sp.]|nr:AAA family ATPase [Rubrivivax sp.]